MRAFKFRIYPTKTKERELNRHLWLAKELWNELLTLSKQLYADFGLFLSKNTLQGLVKDYGLYSQVQQAVAHRVFLSVLRFLKLKRRGVRCGFPRFKSFSRVNSLYYPQFGFSLDRKLTVRPFGEIQIRKHREIKGKIKTLTLKKEASGKWFAVFAVDNEKVIPKRNVGPAVGLDLGLKKFAVLSNGIEFVNPQVFNKHHKQLAFEQRKLSNKLKGSTNFKKQKLKIALIHEKIVNARRDFLHNISRKLVRSYSLIALEDLHVDGMLGDHYLAKGISDASWSKFTSMLCYKAEEAGCQLVLVNPRNTSKTCSVCGTVRDMFLNERVFECSSCRTVLDRDLNAARNILAKATSGTEGSNACGNIAEAMFMKQEAHTF